MTQPQASSSSWQTTAMAPIHQEAIAVSFSVGSYVWSTDPTMRFFIRGTVVRVDPESDWWTGSIVPDRRCAILITDAPKVYCQLRGGLLRVRCSKLVAPSVLERLAFEAASGNTPRRHQWPSKRQLKMSI